MSHVGLNMTSINVQLVEVEALLDMFPNGEFEINLSSSEIINEAGKTKKTSNCSRVLYSIFLDCSPVFVFY